MATEELATGGRPRVSTPLGAVLAMAGVNVIWGVAFPITKPALGDIPPFTFATLRFALALVVLLPLASGRWRQHLRGVARGRTVLLGLFGFTLVQAMQMLALRLSPASDIALISTTGPLWITLLAWPMLGERPAPRDWAGFGLALAGLALIVSPDGPAAGGEGRLLGDAIYVVGSLIWALYNVLGKELMAREEPVGPTAAAALVGTAGMVPFAAWELAQGAEVHFSFAAGGALLYTALLVTVVGFLVLFWAYRRVSAAQVAITMYLQPLAGVVVAWWFLGEPLVPRFLLGAALVLGGVGLVTLRRGR